MVFQDAGGLLTQEGLYFFKGCNFSSSFAGPLVLALPGLTALRDPIIRLPLPQSSSRFVSRHSKIRTHIIPLPNAVVFPLIYLCPNNLCRWTYPLEAAATRPLVPAAPLSLGTGQPPREREDAVAELSPLRTAVWQDEQLLQGKSAPPWLTWKLVQ